MPQIAKKPELETQVAKKPELETQESVKRFQIDFTQEALRNIDRLKAKLGLATRAMVIRNALRMYEWFADEVHPSDTIKIYDSKDELVAQFKAGLLLK